VIIVEDTAYNLVCNVGVEMAALPTARGYASTAFLQHLASEQLQSTDSTGSQDSIMTQVPLPFHQTPTKACPREPIYAYTGSVEICQIGHPLAGTIQITSNTLSTEAKFRSSF
jgi:hypothetical protein